MPTTEELVHASREGETAAFADLVRRYQRTAILSAYAVLGDFHLAQDVAQEAFVAAYRMLGQLRDAAAFGPWLLKIVRRQAMKTRLRQRDMPIDDESLNLMPTAPDWLEPYQEVVRQMERLPEHERIVTVMRYIDGRTMQEIAETTGRPVGTVTKQLSRAIERLRHWLIEVPT